MLNRYEGRNNLMHYNEWELKEECFRFGIDYQRLDKWGMIEALIREYELLS